MPEDGRSLPGRTGWLPLVVLAVVAVGGWLVSRYLQARIEGQMEAVAAVETQLKDWEESSQTGKVLGRIDFLETESRSRRDFEEPRPHQVEFLRGMPDLGVTSWRWEYPEGEMEVSVSGPAEPAARRLETLLPKEPLVDVTGPNTLKVQWSGF